MPGSVLRSHATHSLSNSRTTDGLKSVSVSKPSSSPSSAITRSLRLCATYDETAASDPAVGATEQTIALPLGALHATGASGCLPLHGLDHGERDVVDGSPVDETFDCDCDALRVEMARPVDDTDEPGDAVVEWLATTFDDSVGAGDEEGPRRQVGSPGDRRRAPDAEHRSPAVLKELVGAV